MAKAKISSKTPASVADVLTRVSPVWRVNVDGDLEMNGQSIASPAQFSPDDAIYATACANLKLAAAAPELLEALAVALDALSLIDCSDAQRESAKHYAMAAITLAGGRI